MTDFIKARVIPRLWEPTTWTGIAAFLGGLAMFPYATSTAEAVGIIGVVVVGVHNIYVREAGK